MKIKELSEQFYYWILFITFMGLLLVSGVCMILVGSKYNFKAVLVGLVIIVLSLSILLPVLIINPLKRINLKIKENEVEYKREKITKG